LQTGKGILAYFTLHTHGDPILEVTAPLQALLAETDLQEGSRWFFPKLRSGSTPVESTPGKEVTVIKR